MNAAVEADQRDFADNVNHLHGMEYEAGIILKLEDWRTTPQYPLRAGYTSLPVQLRNSGGTSRRILLPWMFVHQLKAFRRGFAPGGTRKVVLRIDHAPGALRAVAPQVVLEELDLTAAMRARHFVDVICRPISSVLAGAVALWHVRTPATASAEPGLPIEIRGIAITADYENPPATTQ